MSSVKSGFDTSSSSSVPAPLGWRLVIQSQAESIERLLREKEEQLLLVDDLNRDKQASSDELQRCRDEVAQLTQAATGWPLLFSLCIHFPLAN